MFKDFLIRKKYIIISIVAIMVFCIFVFSFSHSRAIPTSNDLESKYYLGGEAVGIKLLATGVLVMGIDRENTGLEIGDIILEVNGCKIETGSELEEYASLGERLTLMISRQENILNIEIEPKFSDITKQYRLGLWVKDSSAGVGTITFYNALNNRFAALGHAITETANQYILPIATGGITKTEIYLVKKGIPKIPGELKGTITNDTVGQIYCNTENGIFGTIEDMDFYKEKQGIIIGKKEEIEVGEAVIYATLDDNVKKEYKIMIEKVLINSSGNKNIAIKITDEELLKKTGGIVQGMSGAPIVQNEKLIGAITHVFLDDPVRGYGAFIENMINDMNNL